MEFVDALNALAGKRILVKVRRMKPVDAEPGKEQVGFNFETYDATVLTPAVAPYPEGNPNGNPCLWIRENNQLRTIYAISLSTIEEVDDDPPALSVPVMNVEGLQSPNA